MQERGNIMTQVATHFLVDKEGLAKLMGRRPKGYVVLELLQNAWDEDVSRVSLEISYNRGTATVIVKDDSAEGFTDLSHAYTLFAESKKKADPTKRGRFNIGEKLVIAICETAEIKTTKGTVRFDSKGRHHSSAHTAFGTIFSGVIKMTRAEYDQIVVTALQVIPPVGIETTFNGEPLLERQPVNTFQTYLTTEVAGDDGYLHQLSRMVVVEIHTPVGDEIATLYEMGIPVVETGDQWHVNVMQKVPLNQDRDNVTPAYLRTLRTHTLNCMAAAMDPEAATANWVSEALGNKEVDPDAVRQVIEQRFGPKRVVVDPSDMEATKRAMSGGYTVIPARAFTAAQWTQIRKAEAALPAGRVTPTPKPFGEDGELIEDIPRDKWPEGAVYHVELLEKLASGMVGGDVRIKVISDITLPWAAACGPDRILHVNIGRVGWKFFTNNIGETQLALLIHELAHVFVSDHLSDEYADQLCRLGAKLALLLESQNYMRKEAR